MSQNCIQNQAVALFEKVKSEFCDKTDSEINEKFAASNGWFYNFKNTRGMRSVVISGESSSADKEAARD